jgi:Spy/CpxP family protein refolding chaperone
VNRLLTLSRSTSRALARTLAAAASALLVMSVSPLQAQPGVQGERGRAGLPGGRNQGERSQEDRAQMERRVEARINDIIRTRLALNDEQFNQLRAVSTRVENERRAMRRDEIATRSELRGLLLATESVNENRIAELLEQLPKLERRRIDMMEQEQRELSKFLLPSQRARYFALQDELRRNLQETQRRRLGSPPGGEGRKDGQTHRPPPRPPGGL